jgi:hypothetical protein
VHFNVKCWTAVNIQARNGKHFRSLVPDLHRKTPARSRLLMRLLIGYLVPGVCKVLLQLYPFTFGIFQSLNFVYGPAFKIKIMNRGRWIKRKDGIVPNLTYLHKNIGEPYNHFDDETPA